jgi:hypothetical protein
MPAQVSRSLSVWSYGALVRWVGLLFLSRPEYIVCLSTLVVSPPSVLRWSRSNSMRMQSRMPAVARH